MELNSTVMYNNANQITRDFITGQEMTSEKNVYTYDANGNQVKVDTIIGDTTTPSVVISKKDMAYDIFNRQTSWTLSKPDGQGGWIAEKSESSAYRGDKWHRTSSTSNGVTTSYLYDGDNVIADINAATGVVIRSYVTPTLDGNISMTDIGGSTYYYNSDERMSVKNLTDSSAAVAQSYDYTAYGDKIDALTSGSVSQRYTYTGRELNDVSGNYYFRYRMYGAGVGGFLSRDPLGYIDGMSMYSGYFARSMSLDPSGRAKYCKCCCCPTGIAHSYSISYTGVSYWTKKGTYEMILLIHIKFSFTKPSPDDPKLGGCGASWIETHLKPRNQIRASEKFQNKIKDGGKSDKCPSTKTVVIKDDGPSPFGSGEYAKNASRDLHLKIKIVVSGSKSSSCPTCPDKSYSLDIKMSLKKGKRNRAGESVTVTRP